MALMRTIAKLFGQSPFGPLQDHMQRVSDCVEKAIEALTAFQAGEYDKLDGLAKEISDLEHAADQVKHDIQNHLPKSLFLPVDRSRLLEILSIQDSIADKAENLGIALTLKRLELPEVLRELFSRLINTNIKAFRNVLRIINELDELVQTSFGGAEAENVKDMVDDVAHLEYEADLIQRDLLKALFAAEQQFTVGSFYQWTKLISHVSELSNLSERLANRVRTTLELK